MNTTAAGHPLDGYRKSAASDGGGQCVLVRRIPGESTIYIRDSKYQRDPNNRPVDEPVISMPAHVWPSFEAVALGRPVVAGLPGMPFVENRPDGSVRLQSADVTLIFTAVEWAAFQAGLENNEFEPKSAA